MQHPDLYGVLELDSLATLDQIKIAYRRLSLIHHPDRGGNVEKFHKISEAYQILSDDQLRKKYDASHKIPQIELMPALKVYADAFNQWLSGQPLVDALFGDSCQEIFGILNNHVNSLTGRSEPVKVERAITVNLVDMYYNSQITHLITIDHKDIGLAPNYRIINAKIPVKIPLTHDQVTVDIDLSIINETTRPPYRGKVPVTYILNINHHPVDNMYRVGENDLFIVAENATKIRLFDRMICLSSHCMGRGTNSSTAPTLYRIPQMGFGSPDEHRGYLYVLIGHSTPGEAEADAPTSDVVVVKVNAETCSFREILR